MKYSNNRQTLKLHAPDFGQVHIVYNYPVRLHKFAGFKISFLHETLLHYSIQQTSKTFLNSSELSDANYKV